MAQMSLYDVLRINQNATLDEIKLAFKRRALQVHPDKGGSKEQFHLVYQALETLGDPAARKKYDHGLATKTGISAGSRQKKRKRSEQNAPSCKTETKTKLQTPGKKSPTSADKVGKARTGHEAARHDHSPSTTQTGPAPQAAASCKAETKPKPQMPERRATAHEVKAPSKPPRAAATPAEPQSMQTKLLMKIRDLLKKLPRDARNDVITNQFSQKQRILLEKWMVDNMDTSSGTQAPSEAGRPAPTEYTGKSAPNHTRCEIPQVIAESSHGSRMPLCDSNSSEAVAKSRPFSDAICNEPDHSATLSKMQTSVSQSLTSMVDETCAGTKVTNPAIDDMHDEGSYALVFPNSRLGHTSDMLIDSAKRSKVKAPKKTKASNSRVRSTGSVPKAGSRGSSYVARIRFDSLEINTGNACDLKTALEDLMILTSVKQKMWNHKGAGTFVERLQAAVVSSAAEHGRNMADLKLTFLVFQAAGRFIGSPLRSPSVRSLEVLGKMRSVLEPFRQYAKVGGQNVYWQFSPVHLEDAWERFQLAVVEAWKFAGVDSTAVLQKICSQYEAQAPFRSANLQRWEQQQMAGQDKNRNRPKKFRERNPTRRLECWERRQMAMEDKNKHRPKKLRDSNPTASLECSERRKMAREDKNEHRPKKMQKRNPTYRLECWERQQMAMEDKNKHRPKKLQERHPTVRQERHWMAMEDKKKHRPRKMRERNPAETTSMQLSALKKLIARWGHMLKREARLLEKERQRVISQRKAQQKDQEEQRRADALNEKRQREEEERVRKRMRSDITMHGKRRQKSKM